MQRPRQSPFSSLFFVQQKQQLATTAMTKLVLGYDLLLVVLLLPSTTLLVFGDEERRWETPRDLQKRIIGGSAADATRCECSL